MSQKKSLTSKKSVNTSSKIDLLDEKPKGKPQINNLMIDQLNKADSTRNNLQKQHKTQTGQPKSSDKQSQNNAAATEDGIKKVAIVVSGKQVHQSNTNPQQPSSSLSGMLVSKSQMTSRSPRKEDLSAERRVPEFPLTSDEALNLFSSVLNDFEKQEIVEYSG